MTISVPDLDELHTSDQAAWLWDGARARIVWANGPGLAFFGCETLFDMIDRPFDAAEPGVERISALGLSLKAGEQVVESLRFTSAPFAENLMCRCLSHVLADGRTGVLVVARDNRWREDNAASGLSTDILSAMTLAVVATSHDGTVIYTNPAAGELLCEHQCTTLAAVTDAGDLARDLLARVMSAGMHSEVITMPTRFGNRQVRVTGRLFEHDGHAGAIVFMLDDVTDRRALEKTLSGQHQPPLPAQPPAAVSAQPERPDPPMPAPDRGGGSPTDQPVPGLVLAALEQVRHPVVLHKDGHYIAANAPACAALGYPPPMPDARHTDLARTLAASDHGSVAELKDVEGRARRFTVHHQQFPWRGGRATQTSLEAKTLAETKAIADDELRAIVDTATDGIVTLDHTGRILDLSAGAEAVFACPRADVIGKPFAQLLSTESHKTLKEYLAALSDGGIASLFDGGCEVTAHAAQGGTIPLFMTMGRIGGDPPRFCAVLRDITQWKKTEADLLQAKTLAEDASSQKSRFIAQISHELRTPLNAILGFSDVMRTQRFGEINNDKYLAYANDIHSSGSHLLSLINDLLDLSKVEAGKLELNFTSVNLANVVDETIALMHDQAVAARVVMRKDISSGLPGVVADHRSMKQIVLNLVSNAIKFTDPGGQVILSLKLTDDGALALKVEDTGIGMTHDELGRALEPFRRVERPGEDKTQGTGLGLPLTRALVEANRAAFEITSERRQGTRVCVTFPTSRVLAA